MNKNFSFNSFFDITGFPFADLFEEGKPVWTVLSRIDEFIKNQATNTSGILIGEGSTVSKTAEIEKGVIIGKDCYVGPASFLRKGTILGDNVHIGHGVEVKNSIFLSGAVAAHLSYIGDSIIGKNVNIAGGAMLANFRFDKKPIRISFGEEKIETNLLKLGAIIGDDSQIGANAVLNPGTIFGKACVVYPLSLVKGVHENGEIVR